MASQGLVEHCAGGPSFGIGFQGHSVGAEGHREVYPEGRQALVGGMPATDEPALRIDLLDEYGGDGGRLAELFGAEACRRLGAVASGRMSDVGACYRVPGFHPQRS